MHGVESSYNVLLGGADTGELVYSVVNQSPVTLSLYPSGTTLPADAEYSGYPRLKLLDEEVMLLDWV